MNLKEEILKTNEKSAEYGLTLSEADTIMLINCGNEIIKMQERIEFGKSITTLIIEKFMSSGYISQYDYANTIAELLNVFYEAKEESNDILTDEEVIDAMVYYFENISNGSIELLKTRDMDYLCKHIRYKANNIFNTDTMNDTCDDFEGDYNE